MDGGTCIYQIRVVRLLLSDKFDITKHKNYKLLEDYRITNIGTLLQLFCNHVLSLIKNWRFLYKYALTCYYLSDYLKGVNKYAARYS